MPPLRPIRSYLTRFLQRHACAVLGHDYQVINWIGYGTTWVCKRPGCDYAMTREDRPRGAP